MHVIYFWEKSIYSPWTHPCIATTITDRCIKGCYSQEMRRFRVMVQLIRLNACLFWGYGFDLQFRLLGQLIPGFQKHLAYRHSVEFHGMLIAKRWRKYINQSTSQDNWYIIPTQSTPNGSLFIFRSYLSSQTVIKPFSPSTMGNSLPWDKGISFGAPYQWMITTYRLIYRSFSKLHLASGCQREY
jgi:hypothetical protein